ncbi:hypothetical protein KHA80_21075 [Anaerobacillus sp. HL2]|nr:hypothetical protein KHA80_21075 [Anaerobacillus sp. HL2]
MIIKDFYGQKQKLLSIFKLKGIKEFYKKEVEKVKQELEKFKEIEYFALQIKEIEKNTI